MKRVLRASFVGSFSFLFSPTIGAQATPGPRAAELVADPTLQRALADAHPGFQTFVARAGGAWTALFDPEGGTPVSIVGSGLEIDGRPIGDLADAAAAARQTLERFPELWGAALDALELTQADRVHDLFVFTWQQRFQGLDVRGATVQIQIHAAGRVASLGTSAFAIPADFSRIPEMSADDAVAAVARGKRLAAGDSIAADDFLVFAKKLAGTTTPRLAYRVVVEQPSANVYEIVFVDANDASVLQVEPGRYDATDVKGNVTGRANTSLSGNAATTTSVPLAGVTVTVSGVGTATTDANGNYLLSTGSSGPFSVSAVLVGPDYSVVPDQGAALTESGTTSNVAGAQVADLVFNATPSELKTSQTTAAYQHNVIDSYLKSKIPTFSNWPAQTVTVNLAQTCNAFYSPQGKSVNFFASGGGCVNTAYSTVVHHEFGHGVDDRFGGIADGGLSEAIGDICAMFATGQPIVGQDFFGPGSIIRTGLNNTSWPASGCGGEPHCMGETFMGFAWRARVNLVNALGAAAGAAAAEKDVLGTFPFNNSSILGAVTQVFLLDDDDGDLTNGTPHFSQLSAAATAKGFPLPSTVFAPFVMVVGSQPDAVALGDLNGDGRLDAVTANFGSANASVVLALAGGGFAPAVTVAAGTNPIAVAFADLDGDGKLDVAVANYGSGTVTFLRGDGLGGFAAATTLSVGAGPASIAVADMNGDGLPDLVLGEAPFGPSFVATRLGAGGGGFGATQTIPTGPSPQAIAVGDLNLDGAPDVVTTDTFATTVSVLLGAGGGALGAPASVTVGTNPSSAVLTDLDGDGRLDLVVANEGSDKVARLFGDGLGGFGASTSFSVSGNPISVAAGDVTGDGKTDVVAANGDAYASVLAGDGAGGFAAPTIVGLTSAARGLVLGDLTGDGRLDAALTNNTSGTLTILANHVATPASLSAYGQGTPGCAGTLGMSANVVPKVNTPAFGILCTNAPANAAGFGLIGTVQDVAGTDSIGVGVKLHVDIALSTFLGSLSFKSDAGSTAFAPAPIPNIPSLAGASLFAQAVWVEKLGAGLACSTSPFHLVSSAGLQIIFQP